MKVAVVEDSRTVRMWLKTLLEGAGMTVVAVGDGLAALDVVKDESPDIVVMDLQLPRLDGITAIGEIMASTPCPIVVLSGLLAADSSDLAFQALEAGALEVLAKPSTSDPAKRLEFGKSLLRTLRVMSQAKVVRRKYKGRLPRRDLERARPRSLEGTKVLAIGASTGGPPVVRQLLSSIVAPARVPILVSQHISRGFEEGYGRWLAGSGHQVVLADGPTELKPGTVYLCPANASFSVVSATLVVLTESLAEGHSEIRPNIDVCLSSLARRCGSQAAGVVLTGMGRDGARGLAELREAGGPTFAQDEASCAVFGMPKAALDAGGVDVLHTPDQLASLLASAYSGSGVRPPTR